jgi:hypothetical protein
VPALFAVTLFASAALLFLVQPLVGKMVLPLLGGSPAVWNTCMVFFQAVLLLGYLYAHKLASVRDTRRQVWIHLAVIGAGAAALGVAAVLTPTPVPVLSSLAPRGDGFPILNVLAILAVGVGVPFFVVSTTAPLLQKWFVATGHPSARDPYFLYAASNAGSLLTLLAYPLAVEPLMRVADQAWVFATGFAAVAVLVAVCGRAAANPLRPPSLTLTPQAEASNGDISTRRKMLWLALAFVPSSLMLGVTTHLTTDIAAIPLLWVLPLALYLLTFIIAFARGSHTLLGLLSNATPVATLLLVFGVTSGIELSVFLQVLIHTGVFFLVALTCHTRLAAVRPDARHLTTFYLWVSLGGVAGGVFNGLLAPVLFPQVIEYSTALAAGCLLLPPTRAKDEAPGAENREGLRLMVDLMVPFAMVLVCFGLRVFDGMPPAEWVNKQVAAGLNWLFGLSPLSLRVDVRTIGLFVVFAPPCLIAFAFADRPVRFGLAVLGILFIHHYTMGVNKATVANARSYFGVLRVWDDRPVLDYGNGEMEVRMRVLGHGTTVHGRQFLSNAPGYDGSAIDEPLTYYHRHGPVGDLFRDTLARHPDARVGAIGLGTGSVSAYLGGEQSITFYEIDPMVKRLVDNQPGDDGYFSYLGRARERGAAVDFVFGDARLTLARQTERKYHLLLVDAFTSDAIPIHLLTVEAMRVYGDRITDDGLIAVHVSNRYLRLEPVVAAIAEKCGLVCRERTDDCEEVRHGRSVSKWGVAPGRTSCTWIVLAKTPARLDPQYTTFAEPGVAAVLGGTAAAQTRWVGIPTHPGVDAWTDDYASVPQVIRSKEFQWFRRKLGFTVHPDLDK